MVKKQGSTNDVFEGWNERTRDVFKGWNARIKVRLTYLDVSKLQSVTKYYGNLKKFV